MIKLHEVKVFDEKKQHAPGNFIPTGGHDLANGH
jgi:hypothetical protein